MYVIRTVIWIWMICEICLWLRAPAGFSVFETLPFAVRPHALDPFYDVMALVVSSTGMWGVLTVLKQKPQPPAAHAGPSRAWLVLPGVLILLVLLRRQMAFQVPLDAWNVQFEHRYLAVLGLTFIGVIVAIREFRRLP